MYGPIRAPNKENIVPKITQKVIIPNAEKIPILKICIFICFDCSLTNAILQLMKAGNKAKPQGEKKDTKPAKKANASIRQNEN